MSTINIVIASASETVEGIIEIATQVETDTGTDDLKALTPLKLEQSALVQTTVAANTAKVTNATHTSEVTGSTALALNKVAISNKTLVTAVGTDHVLIGDASDSDNLKKVLVSDFLGGGSDKKYLKYTSQGNTNPADSSSFYFGANGGAMGGNENNSQMIPLPSGITITEVHVGIWIGSTFATNEAATLKIVSDALVTPQTDTITTNLVFPAALPRNAVTPITGLSITPKSGASYLLLETPAWVTNPVAVKMTVLIVME